MRIKSCPVQIKAAGAQDGTDEGVFEAIVAAYNIDSVGDKIIPGAFEESLAEWKSSGDPIPVLWSHMSQDPDYHIGWVLDAEERADGLWVKAQMDPEDLADKQSKASKVYKLLKGRRVTQFSFAYDILEGAWVEKADDAYYELRKLKLFEVGPTLIGANQTTELLDVKSGTGRPFTIRLENSNPEDSAAIRDAITKAFSPESVEVKAGRVLSAKNESRIKTIADLAKELLDSVNSSELVDEPEEDGDEDGDDEKATQARSATPEEPAAVKGDEPTQPSPASLRLRAEIAALAAELDTTE